MEFIARNGWSYLEDECRPTQCGQVQRADQTERVPLVAVSVLQSAMAMGKRKRERQPAMWVTMTELRAGRVTRSLGASIRSCTSRSWTRLSKGNAPNSMPRVWAARVG